MAGSNSTPTPNHNSESIPEWGAPEWDAMDSEEFANKLLSKMEGEDAILTLEEMDLIERFWNEDRRTRRCALVALTKPFKWLQENVEADRGFAEAQAEVFTCLDPGKYEAIANLLRDAQRRAMCSLVGREDMDELLSTAGGSQHE